MRTLQTIVFSSFIFFAGIQFAAAIAVDKPKNDFAAKNFSQTSMY